MQPCAPAFVVHPRSARRRRLRSRPLACYERGVTGETPLPAFTRRDAEAIARRHFGVRGTARPLPSYIDRNFLIESLEDRPGQPDQLVLKIANVQTSRSEMEFECLAMEVLHAAELPLQTPRVQRAEEQRLVEVEDDQGNRHVVRMVEYLQGTLLANAGITSDDLLRDLGRGLALVDRALADVEHPAAHRELPWDLARAGWIAEHLPALPTREQRILVERALLHYQAYIVPALGRLPRGVIHNDANDHNVLVHRERISGLFDFGDMVSTCRVFEPVIAATYAAFHRAKDPLEAIAELAAGYDEEAPLLDEELEVFHAAVAARLAVSVVSSAKAAAADPAHDYAAVSEEDAWSLLERLHTLGPAPLHHLLRERCERLPLTHSVPAAPALLETRQRHLGPSLSLSYDDPLTIVRGQMQYLFDPHGRAYLDGVNNVCHVGHCRPEVVSALADQAAVLNTNTRYLHPAILEYAERLTATLPDPLEVCFFVCTGSEANELALRMARSATDRHHVAVLDHAYHGSTSSLIELSPYKFEGRGGAGRPGHVHVAPAPDPYRVTKGVPGPDFAEQTIVPMLEAAAAEGHPVGAFFAESLLGCGGQIVPPDGYLARAFELVRNAGGLAIADEVQVGFGRVGSHMWGVEAQAAIPDIVTMGKPIGNGHPMAAVVTTREIADRFANGMEYFNTFGGNPVSCRVGLAVLDVIERDGLREHAQRVGARLREMLTGLAKEHALIGDVRGMGLFIGIELVRDRQSKEPAVEEAAALVEHCRSEGVLLSVDGPHHNVLKIKPPLVFDEVDARLMVGAIGRGLVDLGVSEG